MAARFLQNRRQRTNFKPEQLGVLRDAFQKNRSPNWETIQELASLLNLEDIIVKTWFKNQRVRWKEQQQQRQTSPSPGPSNSSTRLKEEESPLPVTPANADSWRYESLCNQDYGSLEPSNDRQPGGAGVPVLNSSRGSPPCDMEQTFLGAWDPPWAKLPYDIDQITTLSFT
ncbi:paired-like homeodomain transcription factor LEUTX [Sciurus carolinensis]|uniref:paired-like homeodomain transcription factor LEUTX n=1 Tax=Sciurus carolinensis TaxID=30640 RepID=UPI001FB44236|nr:paired-like homeodomain transcription factor LEUTX [Sciurus carolinensis]